MGAPGRFVWHDLMTTDVERARAFYRMLFGWRYEIADMGEIGEYTVIHVPERAIGGMVALEGAPGVPSHWIAYVTVDDLDAAVARGEAAGGARCLPPSAIPDLGRFAVVTDPAGAVISPFVFTGEEPADRSAPSGPGTVCWNELLTTAATVAGRFYGAVFGWGRGAMSMGPARTYHLFERDGKGVAGMLELPVGAIPRPLWVPYFAVADVDSAHAEAVSLGAGVEGHVAPRDVPGAGRFATLGDPTGAAFGLFTAASA